MQSFVRALHGKTTEYAGLFLSAFVAAIRSGSGHSSLARSVVGVSDVDSATAVNVAGSVVSRFLER